MERPDPQQRAPNASDSFEFTCYRNFAIGGALFVVGLALTLTVMLAWLGVPMIAIGCVVLAYAVICALRQLKRSGIEVACPYCSKQYRIMPDRRHLLCDDCQREIPIPRAA